MIQTFIYLFMFGYVLIYPPAILCMECYKSCMRRKKLTPLEVLMCCIPLYNLILIRKSFYGSATIHTSIVAAICALIVFRAIAILALYNNALVVALSSALMIVSMALIWILSALTFIDTAILIQSSFAVKLFSLVLPPLGAYLVSRRVRPFMASLKDELDDTFKG